MSLSGHFNKSVFRDKRGREIRTEADFLSKRIRQADGSFATMRGGKVISKENPAAKLSASRIVAREDAGSKNSRFFKETQVSTLVETKPDGRGNGGGEKETAGETETALRTRKPIDVNRRALKL
jgi:hypothetical protein